MNETQKNMIHFTTFLTLVSSITALCLMNALMIKSDVSIGYERTLIACTLFRDDGMYLKEWVGFHHLIGVEHFYLYNHGSLDNPREVLNDFIQQGIVTLIDWPPIDSPPDFGCKSPSEMPPGGMHRQASCQVLAFDDCILRAKRTRSEWIAIMDVDEFFYTSSDQSVSHALSGSVQTQTPKGGVDHIRDTSSPNCYPGSLKDVLTREPSHVATIQVGGWVSGTQGYENPVSESVIESYLYRNPKDGVVVNGNPVWQHNDAVKSIGKSSHVSSSSIHTFSKTWGSFLSLYTTKRYDVSNVNSNIKMRHFPWKSYKSLIRKVERNGYTGISYRAERDYWHSSHLDMELYECAVDLGQISPPSSRKKHDIWGVKMRKSFWSVYRSQGINSSVLVLDRMGNENIQNYFFKYAPPGSFSFIDTKNISPSTPILNTSWELLDEKDETKRTTTHDGKWWFMDIPSEPFPG